MTVRVENAECIYCIGDSHASFFAGSDTIQPEWPQSSDNRIPFFRAIRTGAVLAYNLASFGSKSGGREILVALLDKQVPTPQDKVPEGSLVMLSYGEIDCRCHVIPQVEKQNRSIESVIDDVSERYCQVIGDVRAWGHRPLVWNAIASSPKSRGGTKAFPIIGKCEERNRITRCFNQRVASFCKKEGVPFVDIFDHLVDDRGLTRPELLMDDIHLSQKAMPFVVRWLQDNLPGLVPKDYQLPENVQVEKPRRKHRGLRRLLCRRPIQALLARANATRRADR